MSHPPTEPKTFAIEMVRAALSSADIPKCYNFNDWWMCSDTQNEGVSDMHIRLLFKIDGAPSQVGAECYISSEDGKWVRGSCTITLVDLVPTRSWSFDCQVEDNQIIATIN